MQDIGIIGYAARLPGASDAELFWELLRDGRCSVSVIPQDRWRSEAFLSNRPSTAGRSITRGAGVLDDVWSFDAARFGISQREALQMDPQQRILLEVVDNALEHAGISRTALNKDRVGVFVGASSADHSTIALQDPAVAEPHFMLGNTLSIIANRVSHTFDFRGPSLTIDTACSSSLVAFDFACRDIHEGRIDTAIVAGVNILLSPIPFVGFSQSMMLSERGICSPFGKDADGYVRAEGAVAFIIQKCALAKEYNLNLRSIIIGSGVNTVGNGPNIAMPSVERQSELMAAVLAKNNIDPENIAFLEAHGTGTVVGDPIEAEAIGHAVGHKRKLALPIGSVKSNIGHLEPASGLAGLLKCQLILEKGAIPPTVNIEAINPKIDLKKFNIDVVRELRALPELQKGSVVGVNSFGFGGVNAHVLLCKADIPSDISLQHDMPPSLLLSAASPGALHGLVKEWHSKAMLPVSSNALNQLVGNANWYRERHRHRVCLKAGSRESLIENLEGWISNQLLDCDPIIAAGNELPVAFVFSGNGAVWAGMAREQHLDDQTFRDTFDELSGYSVELGGPDLCDLLWAEDLGSHLADGEIAQPMHVAIQIALCRSLAEKGVRPSACLGHSLGEVSAAVISGNISPRSAMEIVLSRTRVFAPLRDTGTMAAFSASRITIGNLIEKHSTQAQISAENALEQVTVTGTHAELEVLVKIARACRIAGKILDIPYPYHGKAVQALADPLRKALHGLKAEMGVDDARFYSGCYGERHDTKLLDAEYWVQNALRPVEFKRGIESLIADGYRVFVEISPKTVTSSYIKLITEAHGGTATVLSTLDPRKPSQRSAAHIARRVLAAGGNVAQQQLLGPKSPYRTDPPIAPFERKTYRLTPTRGPNIFARAAWHPLLGARSEADAWRWRMTFSTALQPWLADHRIAGRVLLPATVIIMLMNEAAQQAHKGVPIELRDLELLRGIILSEKAETEILTEWEAGARRITVSQRVGEDWVPSAVSRAFRAEAIDSVKDAKSQDFELSPLSGFYDVLRAQGLDYGPNFARLVGATLLPEGRVYASIAQARELFEDCGLDPAAADAGLHAVALLMDKLDVKVDAPMVPTRIGRVRILAPGQIAATDLHLHSASQEGAHLDMALYDGSGQVLMQLSEVRLRPFPMQSLPLRDLWVEQAYPLAGGAYIDLDEVRMSLRRTDSSDVKDIDVLRAAVAGRVAWEKVKGKIDCSGQEQSEDIALCLDYLEAQGLAKESNGTIKLAECPWPELDKLVPAMAEIEGSTSGEFGTVLSYLTGATTEHQTGIIALPRMQRAVVDLIEAAKPYGRVALCGPVGREVVTKLLSCVHPISIIIADPASRSAMIASLGEMDGVRLVDLNAPGLPGSLDVIVGVAISQSLTSIMQTDLGKLLAPQGCFLGVEECPDLFALLTKRHRNPNALDRLGNALEKAGLESEFTELDASDALMLVSGRRAEDNHHRSLNFQIHGDGMLASQLRDLSDDTEAQKGHLLILNERQEGAGEGDEDIIAALRELPSSNDPIWLIDPGLERFERVAGWRRVLVNETGRDLRLCAVDHQVPPDTLLKFISETDEREIKLDLNCASSLRLLPFTPIKASFRRTASEIDDGLAFQLRMPNRNPMLDTLQWRPASRVAPDDHDIEIAVEAIGLNFRDLMWAQGLIPPESLENGFAGQGFGMECAGRVLRAGGKSRFRPGDVVATFAPNAFATHVTVDDSVAFSLPAALSSTQGAALPVVFLTADYALVELAQIKPGETVLIHAGAGGVGLAAIQIARNAGAKTFVTAGTPERRQYLELLGVDAAFDSRGSSFVDDVLKATNGKGVDLVLNSLAGGTLELSLACLAPFGRFIELGKRDIFSNSTIGMRALKDNISFMAVDVDQLMRYRPEIAKRVMTRVADGFEVGRLRPLPVSVYDASDVAQSFRLMQRAGHIGKIVVRPPVIEQTTNAKKNVDLSGVWLITGGTQGFGLATAKWLVARGAQQLWLISRSGKLSDEDKAELKPATIEVRAADVSDAESMAQLAKEIAAAGRLDGIVHAAGLTRDKLFENLDVTDIASVLAPKAVGGELIDNLARQFTLRHFWLYSSVAARFGNPGQAPYVAANHALEALAARRMAESLPALAIGWGPIADVGILAKDNVGREALSRKLGKLLNANEALDRLHEILCNENLTHAITIAPMIWSKLAKDLPIIKEPLFEFIQGINEDETSDLNLSELIADLGEAEAHKKVVSIIRSEMAVILRCAPDDIDITRPVADLGFDSLMAIKLRLAIEEKLAVDLPVQALGADITILALVKKLFATKNNESRDDLAEHLEASHLSSSELPDDLREAIIQKAKGRGD
jgi:phthiocerol/phenolphthiocerol synthesis type-I polyketide synthase C